MRKSLNRVPHGTYKKIAEELGYSYSYVAKVAKGHHRNVIIERELMKVIKETKNHYKRIYRI